MNERAARDVIGHVFLDYLFKKQSSDSQMQALNHYRFKKPVFMLDTKLGEKQI
jgi:hypothetical protein